MEDEFDIQEVDTEEEKQWPWPRQTERSDDPIAMFTTRKSWFPKERTGRDHSLPDNATVRVMRAFHDYVELGDTRTYQRLAEIYEEMAQRHGREAVPTTSVHTLRRWGKDWNWDLQIKMDMRDIFEEARQAKKAEARAAVERHARSSRVLQQIGLRALHGLVDPETGELTEAGKELSPTEARKMILEGARLEREILGGKKRRGELTYDDGDDISYE